MLTLAIQETTKNWQFFNKTLFPINESDYQYLVELLDCLIDEVGKKRLILWPI